MKRPVLKPELKFGAEPKKLALLLGLVAVGAIVYYINSSDTPSNPASAKPATLSPIPAAAPSQNTVRAPGRMARQNIGRSGGGQGRGGISLQEFKPTLKPKDPIDPAKVDPILKLNLLANLKNVGVEGTSRSLFDFAGAPAAPTPEVAKVKPIIPGPKPFIGPVDVKGVQERAAAAAPKPPPPPIPLKFYGFTSVVRQGHKRAFFLEGEDIFVAGEGEVIKNRYKVVRIGVNSAVVEDTSNQSQQTLPLEAEGVAT